MINNGVPENCCDKNHFDTAAPYYNITLKNSGFNNTSHTFQVNPRKL